MKFKEMEMKYDLSMWAAGIVFWIVIVMSSLWVLGAFGSVRAHEGISGHTHAVAQATNPTDGSDPVDPGLFVTPPDDAGGMETDADAERAEQMRQFDREYCANYKEEGLCVYSDRGKDYCQWADDKCSRVE